MRKVFVKKVKILNKRPDLLWHWQTGCHSLKITSKFFCQPHEVSRKIHALYYFQHKIKKYLSSPREDINAPPQFCQRHVTSVSCRLMDEKSSNSIFPQSCHSNFLSALPLFQHFPLPGCTIFCVWQMVDSILSIPDLSTSFTKQTTIIISMLTLLKTLKFQIPFFFNF